jgi:hypothetical protein
MRFTAGEYAWDSDGRWRLEREGAPFPARLAEYVQNPVPVAPAPRPDAATIERLRVLGYVESETAPPQPPETAR